MTILHSALTGANNHGPFHYEGDSDPGAVGAKLWWFQPSTGTIFRRNSQNTGWVSVLAAGAGSGVTNATVLPSGSTWTDVETAISQAPDTGHTIILPNEEIIQTAGLFITKNNLTITGSGPLSSLKINADVSLFGSGQQIRIAQLTTNPGVFVENVTLQNFIMEHSRAISTTRTAALNIMQQSRNTRVIGLTFVNITQSAIVTRDFAAPNSGNEIDGVYIVGCTFDEVYESFWEHREGSMKNFHMMNCTGTVTAANPNGAVSRPSGFFLNIEDDAWPGLVENLYLINNSCIATLTGGAWTDSIGMAFRNNSAPDHRYANIHVHNNHIEGWNHAVHHFNTQISGGGSGSTLFPGAAHHYFTRNTFKRNGSSQFPIFKATTFGKTGDQVLIADNDFHKSHPSQVTIENSPTFVTIVTSPANRTHEPA